MKRPGFACILLFLSLSLCLFSGCEQTGSAQSDFAPGAFPPTIPDTEDHRNSWTRDDCLACHETGIQDAPPMRHLSVPDLAKDAKCRTCHVFIAGAPPAD